jgi:hypothetical protein
VDGGVGVCLGKSHRSGQTHGSEREAERMHDVQVDCENRV